MTRPPIARILPIAALLAAATTVGAGLGCPGPTPAPPPASQIETGAAPGERPPPVVAKDPETRARSDVAHEVSRPTDGRVGGPPSPTDTKPPPPSPDQARDDDVAASAPDAPEDRAPGREGLTRAYVELYCAQRRGETTRLRAIYAAYGFEDPGAWRVAWDAASEDRAWLAEVTQRAIAACP